MKARYTVLLIILALIEIWMFTHGVHNLSALEGPFFVVAVALSVAFAYRKVKSLPDVPGISVSRSRRYLFVCLSVLIFLGFSYSSMNDLSRIFASHPVSGTVVVTSDVIPTIIQIATKLADGEWPYSAVVFQGYAYPKPTYLPAFWAPFAIGVLMHFDVRYVSATAYVLVSLLLLIWSLRTRAQHHPMFLLIAATLPLLLYNSAIQAAELEFAYTVEAIIAAYYLLFGLALSFGNPILIGLAVSLCLLSRFSLLLWLPLPVIAFLLAGERKKLMEIVTTSALSIALAYVIPFLSKDPGMLNSALNSYNMATIGEWDNAKQGNMWHLGNGLGFTGWFLELFPTMSAEKSVEAYKPIHFIASILTTAILTVFYIFRRRTIGDVKAYLLFSLKIYLAVFYVFIQIPYHYLMIVPAVFTCCLVFDACKSTGVANSLDPSQQGLPVA
jgi:hypothetical protein